MLTAPLERTQALVQIARAQFTEALWSLPFPALLAAACAGRPGLSVLELPETCKLLSDGVRVCYSVKPAGSDLCVWTNIAPDLAVMRAGPDDRALLYAQNF